MANDYNIFGRLGVNQLEKIVKHGKEVWANVPLDEQRREECMCLHCNELNLGQDDGCEYAKMLLTICRESNMALMVTRCPHWAPKVAPRKARK